MRRRFLLLDQGAIDLDIFIGHAFHGEALLELFADAPARQFDRAADRRHRFILGPHDIAGDTVVDAIASIITRPNGSTQSIGQSRAAALPRKSDFWASLISPIYSTWGWSNRCRISVSK